MSAHTTERRVIAAVRFIDQPTGELANADFEVVGDGSWVRNRSGLYVLVAHPDLKGYVEKYDTPPTSPAAESITIKAEVRERGGRYMGRAFSIKVPRRATSTHRDVFQPVSVALPPTTTTALRQTWAPVRVSVRYDAAPGQVGIPIEGALVSLKDMERELVYIGLTDRRGEALVISSGIPLFRAGDNDTAIFEPTVAHKLSVVVDPAATDPENGRRATLPDPEDLWARRTSIIRRERSFRLAAGQAMHIAIEIPRP